MSFTFGTSAFNNENMQTDAKSDLIDSLQIKETIMLRVNESLKDFKLPDDENVCKLFNALLPPLVGALGTCISVVVGEVMDKALKKIETYNSTHNSDPVLMANVRRLTFENDRLEQYTRRENLRVFGVPVTADERPHETEQKAIEMMKKTGVTITKDDIADCHRVGRFHDGSRPIIVRFVNRRKRTEVMRNKKALRDKDECKKVYLNDDLTSLRARLLKYVKDLPKVDKAWTIGGRIFCEKKRVPGVPLPEQSKPVIIESPDDLVKLGETTVDWTKLGLAHLDAAH